MFCPNCGNNCENANFCPKCGTKLPQQAGNEAAVWQIGKPCPHCGGTKLEGNCCAFCGAQLVTEAQVESAPEVSSDIPYGVYKGVSSSITLYKTACVVVSTVFFKKTETRIPYDQITSVVYVRPPWTVWSLGYLLIRWAGNKDVPIRADNNFSLDKTTVTTDMLSDTTFYYIYYALKMLAPPSAEFKMVVPTAEPTERNRMLAELAKDNYFDKYAPFRDQAVDAMCENAGTNKENAAKIILNAFDERQREIYEADPIEAVRDWNRICDEVKRKEAEKNAERQKELERYRQMDMLEEAIVRANRRT